MSDMKLSIEIGIEAEKTKAELEKLKAKLEALAKVSPDPQVQAKIKAVTDQLSQMDKVLAESEVILKDTGIGAKKAAEDLKKIADEATMQKMRVLSDTFMAISGKLTSLGKEFIAEAKEVGGYERQIKNLAKSTEEAQKALSDVKAFSAGSKIWDTKSVTAVGAEIVKFGLNVKETLPLIAKFAEQYGQDITEPAPAIIKALAGVRGGMGQLATQYGISNTKLKEYGAEMTSAGKADMESLKTKEALIKIIKDSHGSFSEAKKATMEYNKAISEVKEAIGKELIPYMTKLSLATVEIARYFESWSESNKKLAISTSAVVIGVTAIGGALVGAGLYVASTIASIGSLIVTFTGAATASAGLGIIWAGLGTAVAAVGAEIALFVTTIAVVPATLALVAAGFLMLIKWTYDYNKAIKDLPKEDMKNALDAQSKALEKLKADFPGIISAQEAYNQAKAKGFENILNEEGGQQKLIDLTKALATEEQAHQRKKEEALKEEARLKELIDKTYYGDPKLEVYEKQLVSQKEVVSNEQTIIDKLREEKQGIYDATDAYVAKGKASAGEGIGEAIKDEDISAELKRQQLLTDTKKQSLDTQLVNLKNFRQSYMFEEMQGLEVDKAIVDVEDELNKDREKSNKAVTDANKKNVDEQTKAWQKYYSDLDKYQKDNEIKAREAVKLEEERFKKSADAGKYINELETKEKERNNIYRDQINNLKLQNDQYIELLDKSTQLYESNLNALNTYNDLLVKRGQKTQEAADKEASVYKKAYSDAWEKTIEPLMEKARVKGINSWTDYERKVAETANKYIEANKSAEILYSTTNNIADSTGKAADSVNKMNSNLQESNKQATELTKTMTNLGNLSATSGGGTPSGLGEFMTPEQAFSNNNSSTPEGGYGHFDDYSNAVKNSMVGEGYGVGRGNLTDKDKEVANYFNSQSKVTIPSSTDNNYGASRSSMGWDRGANGFGYGQNTGGTVINNNYNIGNNVPASPAIQRSASDLQANVSSYPGYNNLMLT